MNPAQFKRLMQAVILGIMALSLVGCASIFNSGPQQIAVKSDPSDAKATIFDRTWQPILTRQTPAVFALERKDGYFRGATYHLTVEKEGYQKYKLDLTHTISGWYFCNILLGGLVGMLIVDPATGAMFTLAPSDVSVVLQKQSASIKRENDTLFVVLRKDYCLRKSRHV